MATIYIDYGRPPFRFDGPWECSIHGYDPSKDQPMRRDLPLAGFIDEPINGGWYVVCDVCADSESKAIQQRLRAHADSLNDEIRSPWLRKLAEFDWELRTTAE